jgi:hypothetical protein
MTSETDRQFIQDVDTRLQRGETWQHIADTYDMPLSTLYLRIKSLGYRTGKRLVPIHAEPVEKTAA